MKSSRPALPDFAADLPTTPQDVTVLRRLRTARHSAPFEALQELVDQLPSAALRPRRTTALGRPEFEL